MKLLENMVRSRGILFSLSEDLPRLEVLRKGQSFSLYEKIWETFRDVPLSGPENESLAELVRDTGAWAVFLPHPESPPHRRRVTRAVLRALARRVPRRLRLFFYDPDQQTVFPVDWDGSPREFFPQLPLVSVVVRTDGSSLVREALSSLRTQTYDRFELLIVSHGEGFRPEPQDWHDFELQILPGKEDRGANLNLGLKAASGRYVAFLDQDDLWRANHLERLLTALENRPDCAVAYSGTILSRWELTQEGPRFREVLRVFREEFDPLRLFFENYIPLNSLLFRRELFLLERFPEGIRAYEDWVFLVKLVLRGANFLSLPETTAEYRIFGKDLLTVHQEKGFLEAEPEAVKRFLEAFSPKAYFRLRQAYLERFSKENTSRKKGWVKNSAASSPPPREKRKEGPLSFREGKSLRCAVVVAARDTPEDLLDRLFLSLVPGNEGFSIYVLDNGSVTESVRRVARRWKKRDGWRKKLRYWRSWGVGIARGYNFLIEKTTEPYLFPVDHDDEVVLKGGHRLLERIGPETKLIYGDSEIIDRAGNPLLVQPKPAWSPDTLLSFNYINHPLVIRRDLWEELNGYREVFEGAQDWDFLLRAAEVLTDREVEHIPEVLYRWRAHPGSLALGPREKPWAVKAARRCLEDALQRRMQRLPYRDLCVQVEPNTQGAGFLKRWRVLGEDVPSVRAIVLTPGNLFRVRQLFEALLADNYPHLTATVVSNGPEPLEDFSLKGMPIKVINLLAEPFNWSRFNNLAAEEVEEDFLLFLNDDLLPEPNMVTALVGTALLTGAGAVGAALFFPDTTLQHNGITTHPCWIAREIREKGTRGELALTRNVNAVTGAVLLTPRKVFQRLGGFDERLPLNFNDVDYCLRLRRNGYRVVLAWEAQAIHFHMTSRQGTSVKPEEKSFFASRGDELKDPYFYRWELKRQVLHLHLQKDSKPAPSS